MKARVVKRGSAAKTKVVIVMQVFWRHVWAVVYESGGVGVVVENKVHFGMRDVSVLRIGIWREGMGEGATIRKGAIIHRGVVNR